MKTGHIIAFAYLPASIRWMYVRHVIGFPGCYGMRLGVAECAGVADAMDSHFATPIRVFMGSNVSFKQ